jgi:poly(3-hydroxybutyrate) depolymerase
MMYDSYQTMANAGDRIRLLAASAGQFVNAPAAGAWANPLRPMTAMLELIALAGFTHDRPDYEIADVDVRGKRIPVTQSEALYTPFCRLLRFSKQGASDEPNVLLAAPMSGHFATLLRGTIRTLLRDHVVYVTDWINPRNIPLAAGGFGLDDYTQHLIDFIKHIGPRTHVVAVCQPAVSALAATAVMAQEGANDQPASLTLMAGPIDTRISPTKVNDLANDKPIEWFAEKLIGTVPKCLEGAGRQVYPGFIQLSAFMSMNAERHAKSFADLFKSRVGGDDSKADAISEFYKEYFAIMDLSADFFLETVAQIFQQHALPLGEMKFKGVRIEPRAIKKTFLLTVEGEKDDICAVGQTLAAQDLCSGLRPYMKTHHMQAGVGHYGVFNGRRWESQIYPVLRNHIQSSL